jgi:hypothetical protein
MAQPATAAVRLLTGEREPVRLATTANITLYGLQTIDGTMVEVGDRVLVKDQTDATQNGIYTASTGQWYRAADARTSRTLQKGTTVHTQAGATNGGNVYVFQSEAPLVGNAPISVGFYISDVAVGDVAENIDDIKTTAANIAAIIAAPVAANTATQARDDAQSARDLSQRWAEGTLPGGAGTKSSKEWANDSGAGAAAAQAARDLSQQYAADAAIVSGVNVPIYASVASAAGSTIAAGVKSIATQFYNPSYGTPATLVGGGTYARMSKADIDTLVLPSAAYFRSTDRYMPSGTVDNANGGYWIVNEPELTPEMFGAVSTTSSDQSTALQAWLNTCAILGIAPAVKRRTECRIDTAVTYDPTVNASYPKRVDLSLLTLRPNFDGGFVFGSPLRSAGFFRELRLPSVNRLGTLTWLTDADASMLSSNAGILAHNVNSSNVFVGEIAGFTCGVVWNSQNSWFGYNNVYDCRTHDCRYGEVLRTKVGNSNEFANENNFWGGYRRQTSASNTLGNAYGVVVTAETGAYLGNNNNRWHGTCFELGSPAGATYRVPVLFNGSGSYNKFINIRHEGGKGPFGIANAKGNGNFAVYNEVSFGYEAGFDPGQSAGWLQVNGARANVTLNILVPRPRWSISAMAGLLSSGGAAAAPRVGGPVTLKRSTVLTPIRQSTAADDYVTNRNALQVAANNLVAVELDTTRIKTFQISQSVIPGFGGRLFAQAFDASGALLTGSATDTWGSEHYVKMSVTQATSPLYGGGYASQSDGIPNFLITCRDEVAKLFIGFAGGTNPLALKGIEIEGFPTYQLSGSTTTGVGAIGITIPTQDEGRHRTASANPSTAGVHGKYCAGDIILNSAPASGAPQGWQCSASGWLASSWVASTAYAVPGHVVTNDTGKMYALVTGGSSAASGGPTGTANGIADGTCVWDYIGVKAAFLPLPNLP